MERSEPTFVPEWLRSTGNATGGGSSAHHSVLSALHSDAPSLGNHMRNKSSMGSGDYESPRSVFLERTSSSVSRRSSSSNGLTRHPYSSFSRSHRDKDRDKEKQRFLPDHWDRDCSNSVASILGGRVQKDILRRSRSLVSSKQSDVLPQKIKIETENSGSGSHINSSGVIPSGSGVSSTQKAAFEKDFPSLGAEEKQGVPDPRRVSSPVLSSAIQSLPTGNSSMIGVEGWTSALAEVPSLIGSSSNELSSVQASVSTSVSGPPNTVAGLNMAEALAQAPLRANSAPQLYVQTQRLEELALKQSRQLIPMTPSASKTLIFNSSDKAKPKTSVRTAEMVVAGKSGQQQFSSSNPASQSLRGVRSDTLKATHVGKFHVLTPVWENGVSSTPKDASTLTNNTGGKVANSQLAAIPVAASAPQRSPSNSKSVERKSSSLVLNAGPTVERKLSSAQAQSRNDFFNLMRKKSSMNHPPALTDSGSTVSSPSTEKFCKETIEAASIAVAHHSIENGREVHSNCSTCENGVESNLSPTDLEEEEARFLRSLGWEETTGEDEGLTEEEINSFFEAYMKLRPSLKFRGGMQPKPLVMPESLATRSVRALQLSSSHSETED